MYKLNPDNIIFMIIQTLQKQIKSSGDFILVMMGWINNNCRRRVAERVTLGSAGY